MATRFVPIPETPDGVNLLMDRLGDPLMLVSRHGLGDNVFFSPCFRALKLLFGQLFFCSSVNAYGSIFHASDLVKTVYAGGVNGSELGLRTAEGFCRHFESISLDLGVEESLVYHFGSFEPPLPYSDERAFVKGRRNFVELFGTGAPAVETPQYHVAPDDASKDFVSASLHRWAPERELITIARYGHTDGGKNFGHDADNSLELVALLHDTFPGRFKFVTLDYMPGHNAADGRAPFVRSVYGFLPCDAASLFHLLTQTRLLITVPTGPMLVGATIRSLKMLTLWKTMCPFHFLDPQFGSAHPVFALADREDLAAGRFMDKWPVVSREAVKRRWQVSVAEITPDSVAKAAASILEAL